MAKWDPKAEPFRVVKTIQGGPFGWRSGTPRTFSTEEAARAAFDAPLGAGESKVFLDRAVLDPAGNLSRWQPIAKRGRARKAGR